MARGSRCCYCCCHIVRLCAFVSLCVSLSSATYAASSCSGIMRVLSIPADTRTLSHLSAADSGQVRLHISSHGADCACLHYGLILSVYTDPFELHLLQVVYVLSAGGNQFFFFIAPLFENSPEAAFEDFAQIHRLQFRLLNLWSAVRIKEQK